MATLTQLTIDGSLTEKKFGATGNITNQSALNGEVIFSMANHGLFANQPIVFTASTGTNLGGNALLPANITAGTTYYVKAGWSGGSSYFILAGVANNFQVSATPGGANIAWGSGFQGVVSSPGHAFSALNILSTSVTSLLPQLGANTAYTSNTVTHSTAVYNITSGKVVIAYIDTSDSSYGKAVVGTVTGDTIAFGTPVNFSDTTAVTDAGIAMATLPGSSKVVIAWSEGSSTVSNVNNKGTSKVGTISGTTISFGAESTFEASTYGLPPNNQANKCMVSDTTSNRVLHTWYGYGPTFNTATFSCTKQAAPNDHVVTCVSTAGIVAGQGVSGAGVPSGTYVLSIINSTTFHLTAGAELSGNPTNFTFTDNRQGWASCGTVSGTTVTWNTPVVYEPQNTTATSRGNQTGYVQFSSVVYDATADKFVIAWEDYRAGQMGSRTRVGTIDGSNNITFGTVVQDATIDWDAHAMCYHAAAGKIVHVYRKYDLNVAFGFVRVGTISGTTITYGTESTFTLTAGANILYDTNIIYHTDTQKVLIVFMTYTDYANFSGTYYRDIYGIAGTVTGTSISLTNAVIINSDNNVGGASTPDPGLAYDTVAKKVVLSTNSVSGTKGEIVHFDGNNITIDLAAGNFFEVDLENLTENISAITVSNASASHISSFVLKLTQGSTARQIEFSELSAFKWIGGTTPTLTTTNNAVDILSFTTYDNGTTWHGAVVGQNFS